MKFLTFTKICVLSSGLNLLDILDELRNGDDEELSRQCDVFDDKKHDDDEEYSDLNLNGIDINDHFAVFKALFEKVGCPEGVDNLI